MDKNGQEKGERRQQVKSEQSVGKCKTRGRGAGDRSIKNKKNHSERQSSLRRGLLSYLRLGCTHRTNKADVVELE